jgi:hypothetical protein
VAGIKHWIYLGLFCRLLGLNLPAMLKVGMTTVALCWLSSAAFANSPQDTITIDGVPLTLNLDVQTLESSSKAKSNNTKGRLFKPTIYGGVLSNAIRQFPDLAGRTLADVSNHSIQPGAKALAGIQWASESKQWRAELELGSWRMLTMDVLTLDDSAIALMPSAQGGVEQWVERQYDLGVELDTLPVPLTSRWAQFASLSFSMGGRKPLRKGKSWTWWFGAQIQWAMLRRSATELERVPDSGVPDNSNVAGPDRIDWVPHQTIGGGLRFALERNFNAQWSATLRAEWNSGRRSNGLVGVGLVHRFVR